MEIFIRILSLIMIFSNIGSLWADDIWGWRCDEINKKNATCVKVRKIYSEDGDHKHLMSLKTCQLICDPYGSLVPRPQTVTLSKKTVVFSPASLESNLDDYVGNKASINEAFSIFRETLKKYNPIYEPNSSWIGNVSRTASLNKLSVKITIEKGNEKYLKINTNESYELEIKTENKKIMANITAHNFFGARHALETLNQLIDYDSEHNSLQIISSAFIKDWPVFPHRGLVLDTARNFISVEKIKKILDGMGHNKLNTFHWHLSDTQSFPLMMKTLPNMTLFGAYSRYKVYYPDDIRELVEYARVRGIKVIPELDAPAHVGHGWEWGEETGLGKLVVCLDKMPWTKYCAGPPCGQMNLANENLYEVLKKVYIELVEMFKPIEFFHFGGDEVNLECWNSSKEMVDWMSSNAKRLDKDAYYKQWSIYHEKSKKLFTEANENQSVPGILWTSKLTSKENLEKYINSSEYIIQIWTKGDDPIVKVLLEKGYKVIFSNYDALYLDCGSASWVAKGTNWCSPYKGWQDIYDNDILSLAMNAYNNTSTRDQVLGAEAALWTEQVDDETVESKIWPRACALAERLWSNPDSSYKEAEQRILQQRERMVNRKLGAERLQPEWCRQNEGQCHV